MQTRRNRRREFARRALQCSIVFAGVLSILGSGGGAWIGFPEWPCSGSWCGGDIGWWSLEVRPARATAQVGGNVVFTAHATGRPAISFEWCRVAPGSSSCAPIPGATGASYTAAHVNLADDQAQYRVRVAASGSSEYKTASGTLAVSSMPGVVYEDGDFPSAAWSHTALLGSPHSGATFTAARSPTGGNPDAYLSVSYEVPVASEGLSVVHGALGATYDPAVLGPIYTIDFSEDCFASAGTPQPSASPLLLQAGRTYVAGSSAYERYCTWLTWRTVTVRSSLIRSDFTRVDGPECGPAETCPDFSATGAPITLGIRSRFSYYNTLVPGAATLGLDNWRVTVWRH